MKIGIIGATGKLGSIIAKKLLDKNMDITLLVRNKNRIKNEVDTNVVKVLEKNLFDVTTQDINKFDLIISAYGPDSKNEHELTDYIKYLIHIFSNVENTRLTICGGVGPLYINEQQTTLISDSPQLPQQVIALAKNETESYKILNEKTNFKWTYIAPALNLDIDGVEQHNYRFFGNTLYFDNEGKNYLSYLDYANAIIEESLLEHGHFHQIISIANV